MKRVGLVCALILSAAVSHAGNLILSGEQPRTAESQTEGGLAKKSSAGTSASSGLPEGRVKKMWEVKPEDLNFSNVFARWAKDAGYRVRWDARKNALVEGSDRITGSFEDAVTYVLEGPGISQSAYPLEVCFYPNDPPLARITRKGEQDKECK